MSASRNPHAPDTFNPEFLLATPETTDAFINFVRTLCTEEGTFEQVYPDHEVVVRKLYGETRKRLKVVETDPVFLTHNPDEEGNSHNIEPMYGLATLHGIARWREWTTPIDRAPGFSDVYQSLFVQPVSRIAKNATKYYFEEMEDEDKPLVVVTDATEAEVERALDKILAVEPLDYRRLAYLRDREDQHDSHI